MSRPGVRPLQLFPQLLRQGRQDLEQVADDAVGGGVEDGGGGVLVDGDDDVGAGHACHVLHGAGDAAGDVELGLHGAAGLADLVVGGYPSGVHRGAGGADCAAERLGEIADEGEVLRLSETAAAGDDDLRVLQVDLPVGLLLCDLGRTVAIWGRASRQMMVAIRLPPKAGRV